MSMIVPRPLHGQHFRQKDAPMDEHTISVQEDLRICNWLLSQANEAEAMLDESDASRVLCYFLNRTVGVAHVIATLRQMATFPWTNEAACLLRSSYDVSLQAIYLTNEPAKTECLARQYLDFGAIEQWKWIELAKKKETKWANDLLNSPRASAMPEIKAKYESVEKQFRKGKGTEHRQNWYEGNLFLMAKQVHLAHEYQWIVKRLHGTIHASATAMRHGAGIREEFAFMMANDLVLRAVGAIRRYRTVPSGQQVDEACTDLVSGWEQQDQESGRGNP